MVIAMLLGMGLAGATGYLIGARTAGGGAADTRAGGTGEGGTAGPVRSGPEPAQSSSLRPDEEDQTARNKTKFDGELAPLAEPWLPSLRGCLVDTDTGGPTLGPDEARHVVCRHGKIWVHFSLFKSKKEKDAGYAYRHRLSLDSDDYAPGSQDPTRKTGAVTRVPGRYLEYAFRPGNEPALCGLWWDRDDSAAGLYLEAPCDAAGIGGNWGVLRELWQRYS